MEKAIMGSKGRDIITGFTGTVIGRCEYISGCNQVLLAPQCKDDGSKVDSEWFDEQRVAPAEGEIVSLDNGVNPGCDISAPKK